MRFGWSLTIWLFLALETPGQGIVLPKDIGDTNRFGLGIQRSMLLMTRPGADQRPLKVLFYGQSITLQYWWAELSQWLRATHPAAPLEIVNLALPGFTSEYLVHTAETDLYPYYPDLLIFQDYGSPVLYEQIIRNVRLRTTADIIIQTDHITADSELSETTDPVLLAGGIPENAWRNYVFIPRLAREHGAELADIRTGWKSYLREQQTPASSLLLDQIHPNRTGEILMRELMKPHFRLNETEASNQWTEAFQRIDLRAEARWSNGVLRVPFRGNRIDLSFRHIRRPIGVRIDGRKPSDFPELHHFGRASLHPGTPWPAVIGLSSRRPLVAETWRFRVQEVWTHSNTGIRFSVTGSLTGADGEGSSTNLFVSKSGRLVVEPKDWMLWLATMQAGPLKPGEEISVPVHFAGVDAVSAAAEAELRTVVLAQGLANGEHCLELTARADETGLEFLSVYDPLARTQPERDRSPKFTSIRHGEGGVRFEVAASGRYVLEGADRPEGSWTSLSAATRERVLDEPLGEGSRFYRLRPVD